MRYDAHDHLVADAYFGVDDEPVVSNTGYSRATQVFDSRGKVTEVAYFGTDGKPMIGKNGYAKFTHRYNDYGDLIEEAYFGTMENRSCATTDMPASRALMTETAE